MGCPFCSSDGTVCHMLADSSDITMKWASYICLPHLRESPMKFCYRYRQLVMLNCDNKESFPEFGKDWYE